MECRNCLKYNGKACELGLSLPCGAYVPHIINPSDKQGDLIRRSGLKKQLETMVDNCKTLKLWGGSISQSVADIAEKVLALCIRAVDEAAAVDAVPVVHGRWINERMLRGGFAEMWGWDCSCCGETIEDRGKLPNFCPNCGADMRGDSDAC